MNPWAAIKASLGWRHSAKKHMTDLAKMAVRGGVMATTGLGISKALEGPSPPALYGPNEGAFFD